MGSPDPTDECALAIEAQADGRWAIKSTKYGWYIGGAGENLTAFTAEIAEDRLWTVHLAMHPQICIRNLNRKAYMHLDGDSLCTDEIIPWGDDATITLVFFSDTGTYGLETCDGRFLSTTGALSGEADANCRYVLVFQGGVISFRSTANGKFVTALGARGTCKAQKGSITRDEQWVFEDSFPQMSFKSPTNSKFVSIKQGIEVAASQTQVTDNEIFQIEPVGNKWSIKTATSKFWTLDGTSVHASAEAPDTPDSLFEIEWHGPRCRIIANNGNAVRRRMNTYLAAIAGDDSDDCFFITEIVNRPRLVLRGEYGFVGTLPSGLVEANKSSPEVYTLSCNEGRYTIQHVGGKFLKPEAESTAANASSPVEFSLELHPNSKLALRLLDSDGNPGPFLETHQNGALAASGSSVGKSTLFEY